MVKLLPLWDRQVQVRPLYLRLIGGQAEPRSGRSFARWQRDCCNVTSRIIRCACTYGHVISRVVHCLPICQCYENVAFPIRAHTELPEHIIAQLVALKLESVGLRGAEPLVPTELSGGMNRRVALSACHCT